MIAASNDLGATQRWLLGALRAAEVDGAAGLGIVRGSDELPPARRLELYRRSHERRLVGALRAVYPALRHALGDELFDAFATDYLDAHPPRGYTLARLGAGLADHLAATRPPSDEAWPDFLIDLARCEWAFHEAYDGPGLEGQPPPLPAAPPAPAPGLRLLAAAHPVGPYLRAVRAGGQPPLPAPRPSFLALGRRDYVVTLVELDAAAFARLAALTAGRPTAASADELRTWRDAGLVR